MLDKDNTLQTLARLNCSALMEKYMVFLIDEQRREYWENYFNPKIMYNQEMTTLTLTS